MWFLRKHPYLTEVQGIRRSPRKAEKRPVYCLNIRIPPSDIDNCLEPSKSTVHFKVRLWHWSEVQELTDSGQDQSSVFSFLYSIVHGFLEKHGFLSRARLSMDRARILPVKADVPRKRRRADSADDSGFMEGDVFGQPSSSDHPTSIHRRESTPSKLVVSIVSRRFSTSPQRSCFLMSLTDRVAKTSPSLGLIQIQGKLSLSTLEREIP